MGDCDDCYFYEITYPTGKGPCIVCKEAYIPMYLMKTKPSYSPICPYCHKNEALHARLMGVKLSVK